MKCASTCARARSISLSVGPDLDQGLQLDADERLDLGERSARARPSRRAERSRRARASSGTRRRRARPAARRRACGTGATSFRWRGDLPTRSISASPSAIHGRREPRHVQARHLHPVFEQKPDLRARARPTARTGAGRGPPGQIAEVSFREIEAAFGLDVARQRQRRVGRVIVGPEERLDVLQAHRAEILDRPDRRPVVGMLLAGTAPRQSP